MKHAGWLLLLILLIPMSEAAQYSDVTRQDSPNNITLTFTGSSVNISSLALGGGVNFTTTEYNTTGATFGIPSITFTTANTHIYSWQLPNISSSVGNTITILNGLGENVSNLTITAGTNAIVPVAPRLTFSNGSSETLTYSFDNVSGLVQLNVSVLPPGSTNVTLSNLCGDGYVSGVEQCDLGISVNGACPSACSAVCVVSSCSSSTTAGGGGSGGAGNVTNTSNVSVNSSGPLVNQSPNVTVVVNTSTGSMTLTIDRGSYGPGEMLTGSVTVVDNSSLGGTLTYVLVDPRGNKYPGVSLALPPGTSTKLLNYSLPAGALPGTWTLQAFLSHEGQLPVVVSADFTVNEPLIGSTSGLVVAVLIGMGVLFLVIVGVAILVMVRRKSAARGPPPVPRRRDPWE